MLPLFLLNGSLSELFKVPALYSHYMEHRSADNSIDLLDFLAMHCDFRRAATWFGQVFGDGDDEYCEWLVNVLLASRAQTEYK